ncbi:hypothetical protein A2627_03140 [Candidatus Woesebacteria bacterium RIFCSPHIGHO2_01_FULL_39_28]|uniref:Uncharacterized protein n=1 Tax=Candidatus Woesebacteria bacterium RIFCSPHIGHO2_01_FULL_39_28 TaxID=1802496 RepID=A0A1F7YC84_9BACT|nr:MAG: hypothetical protein A2627_03140 [Candidatus Woesebacteria bacterium RIFCSPHIGHO2_01_FULL_39_28]OGM58041.1 MAG: hypothetical protein A3A50_02150 [Candidatus Woesebacteria bacterium RIFCSPLOWO2_01_FULL_38_20]
MGYFKDTIKGISWVGAFRFFSRFVAVIKTAILARILVPAQFGTYGIATLVLTFLEILTETGINIFLIQEKDNIDNFIDTAWIVSIIRGILISLAIVLAVPFVILFFNSSNSRSLLFLISLVPFIRGFINPSVTKIQKNLQFHIDFWYRSSIFVFDALLAVTISLITRSPIGLIWGLIGGALLEVYMSFKFFTPRPKFAFEHVRIRKVINRGKWITASGIFNYLFKQGDDIVVGRLLGESSLGFYQTAYKISTLPVSEVADVVGKVTFPVYVKISEDRKRLEKAFIKTTWGIFLTVLPLSLLIFVFAKEIVLIVLGVRWLEIVPTLRVLSVYGFIRSVVNSPFSLFLGLGKQEYVTYITLLSILGLGISIIPLVKMYGILGAGLSTIVGTIISLPLVIYYTKKVFHSK